MMEKDFFNEYFKSVIWDGRNIKVPFLMCFVNFKEDGLKSQELAEIKDNNYHYICH